VIFECVIVSKPYANCFAGVCRYVEDNGKQGIIPVKKIMGPVMVLSCLI